MPKIIDQKNLLFYNEDGEIQLNELLNLEEKNVNNNKIFIYTNNKELSNGLRFYHGVNEIASSLIVDRIEMCLPYIIAYKDNKIVDQIDTDKSDIYNVIIEVELSSDDNFVEFKCLYQTVEENKKEKIRGEDSQKQIINIFDIYPEYLYDLNEYLNDQIKAFNSIVKGLGGNQIELVNLIGSINIISPNTNREEEK